MSLLAAGYFIYTWQAKMYIMYVIATKNGSRWYLTVGSFITSEWNEGKHV